MNYDKLSRSLRYYYEKGIMQKVMADTDMKMMIAVVRFTWRIILNSISIGNTVYFGEQKLNA